MNIQENKKNELTNIAQSKERVKKEEVALNQLRLGNRVYEVEDLFKLFDIRDVPFSLIEEEVVEVGVEEVEKE